MRQQREPQEFEEKVIQISRVTKKTTGGNKMGFSILMVVGDKKGRVGIGLGKAQDVMSAIRKGVKKAKKKMITVPMDGTTIPFPITVKKGAGKVLLKPAPKGSGIIAGGPVRAVVEAAGVRDVSSKILGSQNQASSVYAAFEALTQMQHIVEQKGLELKSIADVEKEEEEKLKQLEQQAKETVQKELKSPKKAAAVKKPSKKTAPQPKKKAVKTKAATSKKAAVKK
ncbi:MAG: 30S ribosomal protein S5 [Pseudomonadales bacterium]|nr:30S ribosomal protein S5 [Candidatus Woesebacteria bacterium]MCB9801722.1 30S ribosomal protein S5 [Pseudomonadales bacterium]